MIFFVLGSRNRNYWTRQQLRFIMESYLLLTTQSMGCCLALLFFSMIVDKRIRFLLFRILVLVA